LPIGWLKTWTLTWSWPHMGCKKKIQQTSNFNYSNKHTYIYFCTKHNIPNKRWHIIWEEIWNQTWRIIREEIWNQTWHIIWEEIWNQTWHIIREDIWIQNTLEIQKCFIQNLSDFITSEVVALTASFQSNVILKTLKRTTTLYIYFYFVSEDLYIMSFSTDLLVD